MKPGLRWQDDLIEKEIPRGAAVLDLGCNDGLLLGRLSAKKRARVQGIELDTDSVGRCVERGVPVIHADLDAGLGGLVDKSFDYVILEETLQTLHRPIFVLGEMLRVGRRGIVSFPNFGHWRVRAYLVFRGRMPVSRSIPYSWYETPNIHHTTVKDFRGFVRENGGTIIEELPLKTEGVNARSVGFWPNLLADTEIALIARDASAGASNRRHP